MTIRQQFASRAGVVMRLWECSLTGCVGRGDEPNGFFEECVRREVTSAAKISTRSLPSRPASFLRWDLPAALFLGGRCVSPTVLERALLPAAAIRADELGTGLIEPIDAFGWRLEGFSGHNVTQAGVGFVLDGERAARDVAFAHDSWNVDRDKRSECRTDAPGASPPHAAYAAARLAAARFVGAGALPSKATATRATGPSLGTAHVLQRRSAAYQNAFIKSDQWNCYHGAAHWEDAFEAQRAFASLLAPSQLATPSSAAAVALDRLPSQLATSSNAAPAPSAWSARAEPGDAPPAPAPSLDADRLPSLPECSVYGSLYNQARTLIA